MSDKPIQPPIDVEARLAEIRGFAVQCAKIASDSRTEDVVILDLRGLTSVSDYFVIGTGTSDRQMYAVVDEIRQYAKSIGRMPFKVADARESAWMLADYVDVVVHLFDAQSRNYYDLESLWGDAPRVDWSSDE